MKIFIRNYVVTLHIYFIYNLFLKVLITPLNVSLEKITFEKRCFLLFYSLFSKKYIDFNPFEFIFNFKIKITFTLIILKVSKLEMLSFNEINRLCYLLKFNEYSYFVYYS